MLYCDLSYSALIYAVLYVVLKWRQALLLLFFIYISHRFSKI